MFLYYKWSFQPHRKTGYFPCHAPVALTLALLFLLLMLRCNVDYPKNLSLFYHTLNAICYFVWEQKLNEYLQIRTVQFGEAFRFTCFVLCKTMASTVQEDDIAFSVSIKQTQLLFMILSLRATIWSVLSSPCWPVSNCRQTAASILHFHAGDGKAVSAPVATVQQALFLGYLDIVLFVWPLRFRTLPRIVS